MASYISEMRHEIRMDFGGLEFNTMEEVLGHAIRTEEDLILTVMESNEPPEEPLEGSAEKHIPVGDSSEDEAAYEAF